jgi:hypothetical protein
MRFRRRDTVAQRSIDTAEVPLPDDHVATTDEYPETVAPVHTVTEDAVDERRFGSAYFDSLPARVNSLLFVAFAAIEGLLALRFTLLAFGASRTSDFVDFVLDVSYPFMKPFENAFANRTWDEGLVEVNTLLAMGVWMLVFLLLGALINALLPRFDDSGHTYRRTIHSSHS